MEMKEGQMMEILGPFAFLNKWNSSQPFSKVKIGKMLCQHIFTAYKEGYQT